MPLFNVTVRTSTDWGPGPSEHHYYEFIVDTETGDKAREMVEEMFSMDLSTRITVTKMKFTYKDKPIYYVGRF